MKATGAATATDVVRRAGRASLRFIRRHGLVPAGIPDRNGEDERLLGGRLDQTVIVYFPGTQDDLYQLRQWYGPLRALHERHPLVVIARDSRAARIVRDEGRLHAITIAHYGTLDDLLSRSDVKLALYVGQDPQNFSALRFTSLVHVFLNHGDSDKGVAVSNQCKAYDFLFVNGQASIDRMRSYTMLFDAEDRCVVIGRPQLDFDRPPAPGPAADRPTVLYAPTWEGSQPTLSYGSVRSHGPRLVRTLLGSGAFRLIYRPHPLNTVTTAEYAAADATIRRLLTEAQAAAEEPGHRIDVDEPLNASMAAADVLVCDVSAVAMDWLPSGKPLVITQPASPEVVTAGTRMLDVVPRLSVADLDTVAETLAALLHDDAGRQQRLELVEYYVGDTTPGAATERFIQACTDAIVIRDREWASVVRWRQAGGG